jgi:amino acid adenylation domain-containing protein
MSTLENKSELQPAEKRALLAEVLRKKATGVRRVPMSFAQQRLWFLDQLEPGSASYNISRAVRLKGPLDFQALQQALNSIVARHESLRTNFTSIDDEPVQTIAAKRAVEIQLVDLGSLGQNNRENEASRLASEAARCPFNLAQDHLLRVTLFRLDEHDHVLLIVLHHIVSDGWSMGVFFRELETLYEAFAEARPSPLADLPIQYGDFVRWQRDWLQGRVLEEQINFWKQQLKGAPGVLELSTDKPRPLIQTFSGAYHTSKVGKELTAALHELSRREGVTLFMTLLAAFQTLLHRYTGQQDIVVGTPIANRTRTETENLIGLFVNTIVLRTQLSGNSSFVELLAKVREVALDAFAHQELPFEKLVEALQPERSLAHMPLFQTLFALQNVPKSALRLGSLQLSEFSLQKNTSKLDLSLYIGERPDGLALSFEYNSDLFDQKTIERLAANFKTLLEGIVRTPDRVLGELSLLTTQEREQVLETWNRTEVAYPQGHCLHELFEAQADRTPGATALVDEHQRLSYSELERRANQLAWRLRREGVGCESLVAVCLERSVDLVVALLGILKTGGAYVPLDPSYPDSRLSFMLEDTKAEIVLTDQDLAARVPEVGSKQLWIDVEREQLAEERQTRLPRLSRPESLAYVIYTSGSTGRPKGVAIEHRSAVAMLQWAQEVYDAADLAAVLASTSVCFDLSVFEIFLPLSAGGMVVLAKDALQLVNGNWGVIPSLINTVPSAIAELLRLESIPPTVRVINLAGEALSQPLVQQLYEQTGIQRLYDLYGPTEDTTYSTFALRLADGAATIGRPITNTQIYLLDRWLQPVPVGVPGEVYIGGAGLARGYLRRPELTAEKFIPNPYGRAGTRLYQTGDVARYQVDGKLQYLGRRDHQVKMRGFRIELGEIENALKKSSSVKDAVVIPRESSNGNRHLVGYVVRNSNGAESPNDVSGRELKRLLKNSLPEYMVPAYFLFINKLPLTTNGKIDRVALLQADGTRPELEESHIGPRDDLERRLAHIWERVLGVPSIGIRDDFFHLGGHSLLAVRLVSEIEKETGQRLPLVSLFKGANIEHLASLLRQDVKSLSWPTLVEIQAGGPNPPLFCVSTPNVNALGYRSLARYLGNDQPVFGLQAQYPEDVEGEHSQAAVTRIATEYLEALRAVQPTGPYQLIGLCRGAHIAYEMACRLEREGHEIPLLGIIDTWVMENTYNYFWRFKYNAGGIIVRMLRGIKKELGIINKKFQDRASNNGGKTSTSIPSDYYNRKQRTFKVYFPGPDFVPSFFEGRIAVFRIHRQPNNRIRDPHLGWGKLAKGGVDLHFIAGGHDTLLKEPYVQALATALKKCLVQQMD